jgi:hypothetical protein
MNVIAIIGWVFVVLGALHVSAVTLLVGFGETWMSGKASGVTGLLALLSACLWGVVWITSPFCLTISFAS